jgi:hypothetical protein
MSERGGGKSQGVKMHGGVVDTQDGVVEVHYGAEEGAQDFFRKDVE